MWNDSITLQKLPCSFAVNLFPYPQPLVTTNLVSDSIPIVLLFPECHKNGILKGVTLSLASFTHIINLSSITLLQSSAVHSFLLCGRTSLFIHSAVEEHLLCFQLLAIVSKTTIIIPVYLSVWTSVFSSLR